jgi:hypothetical protein
MSSTMHSSALSSRASSSWIPKAITRLASAPPLAVILWFYRRQSPFFRRSEAAVQKCFLPFQQPLRVQCAQQRPPRVEPDILLFPLPQAPPAGRRRRILVRQKPPRRPVWSTHRMPSRQARLDAQGRPRLSLRRFGSGSSCSISFHCASFNSSNRFLLMQEVQQTTHPTQKSPA